MSAGDEQGPTSRRWDEAWGRDSAVSVTDPWAHESPRFDGDGNEAAAQPAAAYGLRATRATPATGATRATRVTRRPRASSATEATRATRATEATPATRATRATPATEAIPATRATRPRRPAHIRLRAVSHRNAIPERRRATRTGAYPAGTYPAGTYPPGSGFPPPPGGPFPGGGQTGLALCPPARPAPPEAVVPCRGDPGGGGADSRSRRAVDRTRHVAHQRNRRFAGFDRHLGPDKLGDRPCRVVGCGNRGGRLPRARRHQHHARLPRRAGRRHGHGADLHGRGADQQPRDRRRDQHHGDRRRQRPDLQGIRGRLRRQPGHRGAAVDRRVRPEDGDDRRLVGRSRGPACGRHRQRRRHRRDALLRGRLGHRARSVHHRLGRERRDLRAAHRPDRD